MALKQVIIIKRHLRMRQGKSVSQGSHSSGEFMRSELLTAYNENRPPRLTPEQIKWMSEGQRKVCLRVDSEDDFERILTETRQAGIDVHVIKDSGATEFHGIPTITCMAIGPVEDGIIDTITGNLNPL